MYQILIVDDELPIREELRLFAFEKLRCEICGQAENGSKALGFIKTNPVDIVITDIRMPVMDGLQLIEKTKQIFPDMQFILLSCINDFEPLQHALKMGVVDYIWKGTYSDDELATATLKAVSNIEEHRKNRINTIKEEYWNAIRFLSRLVQRDEIPSDAALGELKEFGVIGDFPFTAVWMNFCTSPDEMPVLIDDLRAEYLSRPDFMEEKHTPYFIMPGGCLLFLDRAAASRLDVLSALGRMRELLDILFQGTKSHSVAANLASNFFIPKPMKNHAELLAFLSKIDSLHDSGFYIDQGSICESAALCRSLQSIDREKIKLRLASIPVEEIIQFFQIEFRAFLLESHIGRNELVDFVSELLEELVFAKLKVNSTKMLTASIHGSGNLDTLIRGITANISELLAEKKLNKYITRAMHYINQDLARPLSLSIVAAKIGISASYLSSLFYRETAKQFNDYITEKRMMKAIDLLRGSNYKVYEVSGMVGIPSYRYFSKLFKEYTGQNPSDFR